MRVFFTVLAAAAAIGCGGSSSTGLFGGADGSVDNGADGGSGDSGKRTDSGLPAGDAGASVCFDQQGKVLPAMKTCAASVDCTVVAHTTSCCGSVLYVGVSRGKVGQMTLCEDAWDKSLPACGCAAGPPTAEDGNEVQNAQQARAECTDIQNGLGVCTSRKN